MRSWLPRLAYDHPVTVLMLGVALLVLGSIAWMRVPLQLMPAGMERSTLFLRVANPGSTPQETDAQVVRPIYGQLSTIPGIKSLQSDASADSAEFQIQFHPSISSEEAYNSVLDRMERVMPDLPTEASRYFLFKFSMDDAPILFMGATLPDEVEDPYYVLTRIVQPRLERVDGVAEVQVRGVPQRNIYIEFDRERIIAHGVDVGALQSRLQADNFQMAAGRLIDKDQVRFVRSLSRISEVEELQQYPVRDGLVLSDIADVQMRSAWSADIARLNGMEVALIIVRKESDANMVDTCQRMLNAIADLNDEERLQGAQLMPFFNQGEMITKSMDNLLWTAVIGGVFAVVILYLFLREWRMTLLISAAIPFSLLITVAVLYFRGDSLNVLSLMGLMLAVGMVVDNAIVVVETIYRRRSDGAGVREAAVGGVGEVNMAIIMSTATTAVVFLPLMLMTGNATFGTFLQALGFPVVFALIASLLVALVFAPLATRYVGIKHVKADPRWLVWLNDRYASLLNRALLHPFDSAALLIAVLVVTVAVPMQQVQCTPVDEDTQKEFSIFVSVPPQASPRERSVILREMEDRLKAKLDDWGINAFYAEVDANNTSGEIQVFLKADAPMPRPKIMEEVRKVLPNTQAGVVWSVGIASERGSKSKVGFTINGEDMKLLVGLGEEAVRRIEGMPGISGARVDMVNSGSDEIRLTLMQDALDRYGISGASAGQTLAFYMRGSGLEPMRMGGREVEVIKRFELEDRNDLQSVLDSPIWSAKTQRLVPLRALVDAEMGKGPGTIRRYDNRTGVRLSVDLAEDVDPEMGLKIIGAALSDMDFPRGYGWEKGDQFSKMDSDLSEMGFTLLMSVIFVFLLMGILFESWILAMSILSTLPMAITGAFWLLWLTGTPFDMMAGIGLVILVGVVVNNGIVLVDLVNQLRSEGMERRAALVEAGRRRFRPILMTALTTICGLIPMAIGGSDFVGIPYAPLGRTVIGGMAAATLLTLIFVPWLYALLDYLRVWGLSIGRFAALGSPPVVDATRDSEDGLGDLV
ncbi:MAG: HAE1 family hydrophobic/amphiphilic exporter-1 [Kiritimatiellia bacterium]|jgi:HAE1 family hydrophobic/amphiphilic exporter-1